VCVDDRGQPITGAARCELGKIDVKTKDYLCDILTTPIARAAGQNGTNRLALRLEAQILVSAAKEGALLSDLKNVFAAIKNQTVVCPFRAKFLDLS